MGFVVVEVMVPATRFPMDDDATISAVTVGNVAFLGVPCDVAAELGAGLKQAARAHQLNPVLIGFACDYIGYCVPERAYEAKGYESFMAFNGPRAGTLVMERLIEMLDSLMSSNMHHATSNTGNPSDR